MRLINAFFALLLVSFLIASCYESKPAPKFPVQDGASATPTNPAPATAVNTSVKHYTCPNNCANGGGDAAGPCPVCGTEMVHNAAYHNQAASPATSPSPTPSTPVTPEPAQNAAGVWHYTCPSGCEGGAGSAGNCAKCGTALAHNSAYHN